jgi:transposase
MTQFTTTTEHLLVAIDVAKRVHEVLVMWPSGKTRSFRVPNTRHEFERLTKFLLGQDLPVRAAFEPTADFHRLIAHWLHRHGVELHLASSVACARVREAMFNSWDKNDRKDARVIMYLLSQGMAKPFHDPLVHGHMHLQELANTYHHISKIRTRCYHSLLNHYLPLFFPEFERYMHSSRSEWFCRFLLSFPTPGSITGLSLDEFIKRAWDVVGRKTSKRRLLKDIYHTAEHSIALPVPQDDLSVETFQLQVRRYHELTQHIQQLQNSAEQTLNDDPDYHRLRTMPGIGPIISLIILAESGDLRRFPHHRQYLSFCGFNLSAAQSGQFQGRSKMSKRGNARLRYAYWLAAVGAIRQRENSFRYKYERYIAKDPANADLKRKAYSAIAAKMARVAHSLIKRGDDYRGYHETGLPGGGT